MSQPWVLTFVGLTALVFGSFAGVLGTRVPAGEPLTGRSHCRMCGTQLRAIDNIPIVSYLTHRGRCAYCHQPYGAHYLATEVSALVFVFIAWFKIDQTAIFAGWAIFAIISAALIVADLTLHRLPNPLVYSAFLITLATTSLQAVIDREAATITRALLGALALFAFYLVLHLIYPAGMGMGDVKLAAVLGLLLAERSWFHLYIGSMAAFITGGTLSLILLAIGRATRKTAIPFGPFMLIGAFTALAIL